MISDETESDESLMVRVQRGDRQAFSILVHRHTQRFYACAFRLCAQVEVAEDVVQDAFLKLWEKPGVWKSGQGAKFTTWFYRVVTNLTLDRLRRKSRFGSGDSLDYQADSAPQQDEVMADNQEQQALEMAIQKLPERQKVALNLCFYEGLSNKDAAEIIGVSVKGLESLLMRAKSGLRDELTRQGVLTVKEKRYG